MNECIDTILQRKSIRSYLPDPIPDTEKQRITEAMLRAHTAVLAAESLGIGTCYIGDIMENYEIHRDLLKLPQYAVPITMLCLGYPTEQQKNRPPSPRLSKDLIISKDSYRHLQPEEAKSLYDANLPPNPPFLEGAENHGQHIYLRKFSSPFMREMRRSVQVMLENWRED